MLHLAQSYQDMNVILKYYILHFVKYQVGRKKINFILKIFVLKITRLAKSKIYQRSGFGFYLLYTIMVDET